ncbi:tail fiber protein [Paenibacillus sp. SAF-054]|uniref:tail fiber protein n=1 Tax=unclassified Paenibacillus TaxID=185978 RepID=UPI003F818142
MSAFTKALTNKGVALQAKAQSGVQLKYTKFVIGDGRLTGQSMPALTNVISPKKSVPITKLKMTPPNQATVGFVLSNQDVSTGFFFRELGLYAMDPDEGEILYLYANAGETADYIPPGTTGTVTTLECENLDVNSGYGTSIDSTQLGATGGKCVKFEYATNGNGKAAKSGDTIKNLLGNKAGQFRIRARVKVDNKASTDKTYVLCMQNPQTLTPFEQTKGAGTPSDEQLMFSPSQMSTDWAWVELPFYWDGVQPVELWTGRPPGLSLGTTIWEDQIQFISEAGGSNGSSDVIEKSFDILAFVGQATNVTAIIDQSLIYVTHPELQEAIEGVKVEVPNATLDKKGIVQLSNATDGTREDVAATEKAVKAAYDKGKDGVTAAGTAQQAAETANNNIGPLANLKTAAKGKLVDAINEVFTSGADAKQGIVNALSALGIAASTSETWASLTAKFTAGKIFGPGNEIPVERLQDSGASPVQVRTYEAGYTNSTSAFEGKEKGVIADRGRDRLAAFNFNGVATHKLSTGEQIGRFSLGNGIRCAAYWPEQGVLFFEYGYNIYKLDIMTGVSINWSSGVYPKISEPAYVIEVTAAGELYVVTQNYFFKFSATGAVIFSTSISTYLGSYNAFGNTISIDPKDGSVILTGYSTANQPYTNFIRVNGATGALIKSIPTTLGFIYPSITKIDPDGNIVLLIGGQRINTYWGDFRTNSPSLSIVGNFESFDMDKGGNIYALGPSNSMTYSGYIYKYRKGSSALVWMSVFTGSFLAGIGGIKVEVNTNRTNDILDIFTNSIKPAAYNSVLHFKQTVTLKSTSD